MKKHLILIAVMLAAIPGFSQTSNLPPGWEVTAFKGANLNITAWFTGFTVPDSVYAEVWNNGVKLSDSTEVIISGDTVTFSLTIAQMAPFTKESYVYLKDGDEPGKAPFLATKVTAKYGYGVPSSTSKEIVMTGVGTVRVSAMGDVASAIYAANRSELAKQNAEIARDSTRVLLDSTIATITGKYEYGAPNVLRSHSGATISSFLVIDGERSGMFRYNAANTTSLDDSTLIIRNGAKRYERIVEGVPNAKWWGVTGNGSTDDSQNLQKAVNKNAGGKLFLPEGTYLADNIQNNSTDIIGAGTGKTILKTKTDSATFFKLGWDVHHFRPKVIENLTFSGFNRARNGVTFSNTANTEISGRWHFNGVQFFDCHKGVYKPAGNIGNTFTNCYWADNNYGYYAFGDTSPFMHAGFDLFHKPSFVANRKAGVYINSTTPGTGQTSFISPHFEGNQGFGIFVQNYFEGVSPLRLQDPWFELNGVSPSFPTVNIEGVTRDPINAEFHNANNVVMDGGIALDIEVYNSQMSFNNSYMLSPTNTVYDSTSVVTVDNGNLDSFAWKVLTRSIKHTVRDLTAFSPQLWAPKPVKIDNRGKAKGAVSYSKNIVYALGGSVGVNSTPVYDPYIFDYAAEFVIPAGSQVLNPTTVTTSGKWYMISAAIKHVSGATPPSQMSFGYGTPMPNNMYSMLLTGKWVNVVTLGKCPTTGTAALYFLNNQVGAADYTIRIQGYQVVEFNTEKEMVDYYNSHTLGTDLPLVTYGTAAPSTGTWVVGDKRINSTPTVGQAKSWVCTVAGTPGTWVSEGTL